jgi:hypothetical protein
LVDPLLEYFTVVTQMHLPFSIKHLLPSCTSGPKQHPIEVPHPCICAYTPNACKASIENSEDKVPHQFQLLFASTTTNRAPCRFSSAASRTPRSSSRLQPLTELRRNFSVSKA